VFAAWRKRDDRTILALRPISMRHTIEHEPTAQPRISGTSMQAGLSEPLLVADIGGTNARFALANPVTLELSHICQTLCRRHDTVEAALAEYLSAVPIKPRSAALAIAGPVSDEFIVLTNSHWRFRKTELRRATGLEQVHVLNDFEALALSLPLLSTPELHQIGGGTPEPHATKVVLGPGTGLGVAGLVWSGRDWIAVAGEGGHVALGARDQAELETLRKLTSSGEPVSAEQALSGPGLRALHKAVAGEEVAPDVDVIGEALKGGEEAALALGQFIAWLARFAGDAALTFGARGGVYIGGGIAPKITAALAAGSFREAFEANSRMSGYLAPIPIFVILAEFATLKGAAAFARREALRR
jgi:glucokinase